MKIEEYFASNTGRGVLSTADSAGNVNAAVYATPHMMEDGQIAFIMRERLSHNNLLKNPNACYLFMAEGKGFSGVRLYLEKTAEEQDTEKIDELNRRKGSYDEDNEMTSRYLVYFTIRKALPLIGSGDAGIEV